jgi:hypothetical protein
VANADAAYRLLFSNPALMRDLLQGVVRAPWVNELDLSQIEPLSTDYVSKKLDQRHSDLVWKVSRKNSADTYVVLLLEHQSVNDAAMALRVAVYSGLLLQLLLRQKRARVGQLPQIVPLVVYCGVQPWAAALQLHELCSPALPGCQHVALRSGYFVLDQGRLVSSGELDDLLGVINPDGTLAGPLNFAALLAKMEHNQGVEDMKRCLQALLHATRGPGLASVREAFESWLNYVFIPRALEPEFTRFSSLQEFANMLQEDPRSWARQWRQEGEFTLLARQLTRKFGPLPEQIHERLQQASEQQLEAWSLAILSAQTLDDVFTS